jgi:GNAT superfamily N-acetyltransferase
MPVATDRLEAAIGGGSSVVLVAEEDQRLIGFVTVYLDLVSVRFGQRAWIEDLAVAPDRRSQGVGHALLAHAKTWAQDRGAQRLGVESAAQRLDAHRFYEREQPTGHSRSFHWQL